MNLLSIFHTGGVTGGLTLVALLLTGWFWYQIKRAQKDARTEYFASPASKNPLFKFIIAVAVLYLIAMVAVAISYSGA